MLPIDTRDPGAHRRIVRSVSPVRRSEPGSSDPGSSEPVSSEPSGSGNSGNSGNNNPDPEIRGVRTAVRELELLHDEMRDLNSKSKIVRQKQQTAKEEITEFMQSRNLSKIGTRDGRMRLRVCTRHTCTAPGKKEISRCVNDVLADHPDLASELLRRLYENRTVERTTTMVSKKTSSDP